MIHHNYQLLSVISIKYMETQIHIHNHFLTLSEVTAETDKTKTMPDEQHNYSAITSLVPSKCQLLTHYTKKQCFNYHNTPNCNLNSVQCKSEMVIPSCCGPIYYIKGIIT